MHSIIFLYIPIILWVYSAYKAHKLYREIKNPPTVSRVNLFPIL